ncbi:MAG: PAS domain-containing protein [Bryobacterales bacterium]
MVVFLERRPRQSGALLEDTSFTQPQIRDEAVQQLQFELQATREDLQTSIEELETSNEELKATNEEVMSMNEELQSTNEELETSREELQSLNEELSTVNSQLGEKVDQLERMNDDMSNLLTSTQIATMFLDTDLRIRFFTPAATDLLNIISADIDRPLSDLAPRVQDELLIADARAVLTDLRLSEREVRSDKRGVFIRRMRPYRTSSNRIEGVVVTYTDITRMVDARERLERRERQQAAVASLGGHALGDAPFPDLCKEAVHKVRENLGVDFVKVLEYHPDKKDLTLCAGEGWDDRKIRNLRIGDGLESQAGYTLTSRSPVIVKDLASEKRFSGPSLLTDHRVVSGLSVVIGRTDKPWGVLGAHSKTKRSFTQDDVNFLQAVAYVLAEAISAREYARDLERTEERLRLSQEAGRVGVWDWDLKTDQVIWSEQQRRILGMTEGALSSKNAHLDLVHPADREAVEKALDAARSGNAKFDREFRITRPDGSVRWLQGRGTVFFDDGKPVRMLGVNLDITDRKEIEAALAKHQEELEELVAAKTSDLRGRQHGARGEPN